MFVAKNIPTDHKDLIHDVAYDFYGKRMATCSSDQSVKVWMYVFIMHDGYKFYLHAMGVTSFTIITRGYFYLHAMGVTSFTIITRGYLKYR